MKEFFLLFFLLLDYISKALLTCIPSMFSGQDSSSMTSHQYWCTPVYCCYSHSIETTLEGSRNSHNADHGTFCGYHVLLLANIYVYI